MTLIASSPSQVWPASASRPKADAGSILTIQALRAIAALMVVAYHAFDMWAVRIAQGTATNSWENGAAGVDIFFVVSGYVMVVSSQRLVGQPRAGSTFIFHRIARIVPMYWLVTTFKLLLLVAFARYAINAHPDVIAILRSYLFVPEVDAVGHMRPLLSVGWTLTFEFLFYGLFALALMLRVNVLKVLVPAFVGITVIALARNAAWPDWTAIFNTIVFEFLFGVVLAKLRLRGWRLPPRLAAIVAVVGFLVILAVPSGGDTLRVVTWGLPAMAIVAGCVSLEPYIAHRLPRLLLALGDASYSIYLIHVLVLPAVGAVMIASGWRGVLAQAFTVVASVVVGAALGWLLYVCAERPVYRWTRRRLAEARAPERMAH